MNDAERRQALSNNLRSIDSLVGWAEPAKPNNRSPETEAELGVECARWLANGE